MVNRLKAVLGNSHFVAGAVTASRGAIRDIQVLRWGAGVGFEEIRFDKPGVSDDPNLRGLEKHGDVIGSEEMNQFITFVAEAHKPNRND